MKIALLSYEYPPETGFGGIGTYTWYQARALAKLGHDVHVVAGATDPTSLRIVEHDGVKVHRFRSDSRVMGLAKALGKYRLWWTRNRFENGVSMYAALRKIKKQNDFDLIEMPECGAEGLFINNFMRVPTVVKFHSPARLIMPLYDVRRGDVVGCSFLEQQGLRAASAYSSCSQFLAGQVQQRLGIRKPVRVIPNGIDLELFDRNEQVSIRRQFDLPANRPIIFFSGRMERRKGIHLCKEIVSSILERFEVSFVFAGQDLFNYMQDTLLPYWNTKRFKGSVHYLGRLDLATVRSCLREAEIFLMPSLWENCPYSCLEAMAAGCAIVSSDQGGMPELIRHGENGWLAESENAAAYVTGLERLLEDQSLRSRLGVAARQTIENSYTDTKIAKLSVDYYLECLGRNAPEINAELKDFRNTEFPQKVEL
jgi:glycogen synthase